MDIEGYEYAASKFPGGALLYCNARNARVLRPHAAAFLALHTSPDQPAHVGLKLPVLAVTRSRWAVLPQLVVNHSTAPSQLAVEVHFQTQMSGLPWFGRLKSPAELLALGLQLSNAGYFIAQRNDNPHCKTCTELLLVRDPCGARRRTGRTSQSLEAQLA